MKSHEILTLADDLDVFTGPPPSDDVILRGIVPPFPLTTRERPSLVWGWQIVRRLVELGHTDFAVRELELTPIEALQLALALENRTGEYSFAEQALIAAYAESNRITVATVSQLVRADGALADQVSRYLNLPANMQKLVNENFVSLKTAERISPLPRDFISENRGRLDEMSFSSRRQFLELASELGLHASDETRISFSNALAEALSDADPVCAVTRLRYPNLTEMEDQFRKLSREVLGNKGVRIESPPFFEGDQLSVSFTFRSRDELAERTRAIAALMDHCDDFLGIL